MKHNLQVLMITSEWPSPEAPYAAPFIVRQVEFLRRADVDVEVFHFCGGKKPLNYLRAWRQVQQRITKGNYDLIHAQWGQSALLALPKKLPLVITFRGSDLDGFLNERGKQSFAGGILQLVSRLVALLADQVIIVSNRLAHELPIRSFEVIPSGIDLDLFHPIEKIEARHLLGLPDDIRIVLFAGNPDIADKRYKLAKSATEEIKNSYPNICLLVANGILYEQMPLYMNASDVLILTSAHEGSPNVVKEALACNLPVVSTDVGDVRERIGTIDGCVVCENDRRETIADALAQVLFRVQRINGCKTVLELDEQFLSQKVIQVYRQAIKRTKKT